MDIVKKVQANNNKPAAKTLVDVNNAGGRLYCGRLVGIASGIKTGTSQYGEWTSLVGSFVWTDRNGVTTRAAQAFGPDVLIMPVVSALNAGQPAANIAADVYVVESDDSPVGFSYVVQSAIEQTIETDPVLALMQQATPVPQLAAPQTKGKGAK